jgi:SAM-dependent methyltransferase
MRLKHLWNSLIRFGFRLLYYELAWTYDLVSWLVSLGDWRAWQRAALPFVGGRDVLEIGHGTGHMLLALQNARFTGVGLDLSPHMGRQAQKRTQRTVPLVRGRVQELPFATAVFDTVLSTFPTEYVVDPVTLAAVSLTTVLLTDVAGVSLPRSVRRDKKSRLQHNRQNLFETAVLDYWPVTLVCAWYWGC